MWKTDKVSLERFTPKMPPKKKEAFEADLVTADKTFDFLNKQTCAVCSGWGHNYACFRKSKKRTKMGCPSRDMFTDLITAKSIDGQKFDLIVK